jgi:arginyl-tRNA synthetase
MSVIEAQNASTLSLDELSSKIKDLGLDTVPQQPNTYPNLNPFDVYRSHITELLAQVTGIDTKIIYPTLQWTATLDKGDLQLATPALRQKGRDPKEFAKEIGEKVGWDRRRINQDSRY